MLKSLNKIVLYVNDCQKSLEFYKNLGFKEIEVLQDVCLISLRDFNIELISSKFEKKEEFIKEAQSMPRGSGIYLLIEVEDVNKYFDDISKRGISTSSTPKTWDWGRREFVLRDPDGYKLVFYESL